jgi:two-component system phosphate regulon sensor histidine kinase PhoR
MVVNRRGVVVVHNERARHVLPGLRSGDPLSFVLRAPEVIEALSGVMHGGKASSVHYQEKVPIERWFEAHVSPIRMDSASTDIAPDYVVITLRDQTNQQRLERMRVDFVANASHELRTPLASLSGFIETLQGPAKNDVSARERFLEIMRGQALRMSRLIDDLLSLSRIELNAHVLPEATVDLRAIVAQTIDALGPLAHETGVDVVGRLGDAPMEVRGERDELYRVCENLIENAIKYGGSGKQVTVELSRAAAEDGLPSAVVLSVKDNGPGISEEHIPRLTERFYRVDTVSSREKGGTGLGLAIVKHIVARHRGRLTIDSRIGEGSTFTVRLNEAGKPP